MHWLKTTAPHMDFQLGRTVYLKNRNSKKKQKKINRNLSQWHTFDTLLDSNRQLLDTPPFNRSLNTITITLGFISGGGASLMRCTSEHQMADPLSEHSISAVCPILFFVRTSAPAAEMHIGRDIYVALGHPAGVSHKMDRTQLKRRIKPMTKAFVISKHQKLNVPGWNVPGIRAGMERKTLQIITADFGEGHFPNGVA